TMLDPEASATRLYRLPTDWLHHMRQSQAAIAKSNFGRVDADSRMRIEKAGKYHEGFLAVDGIRYSRYRTDFSNIYSYFPIQNARRDELLHVARKRGRDFAAQHLRNCADLPTFAEFFRDCPNARAAARQLVLLPTYPRYPESEILRNISTIRDFLRDINRE